MVILIMMAEVAYCQNFTPPSRVCLFVCFLLVSLIGNIYGGKKRMCTERIRIVLDSQKTSKDESKPGRPKKSDKQGRLAEVPKIFGIEEIPVLCWWLRRDLRIRL